MMKKAVATLIALVLTTSLGLQGSSLGSAPKRAAAFDLGYHNDKVHALQKWFDPDNEHPYVWTKMQIGDIEVDINTTLQFLFNEDARHILDSLHFDDHYQPVPADSFQEIQDEWDGFGGWIQGQLTAECGPNLTDGEVDRLLLKMGEGLHMVEDFYSHSDYVELLDALGPALPTWDDLNLLENAAIKNALMNGVNITQKNGQLPVGQTPLYTGAYKNTPPPGSPQLKHDQLNKDSPGSLEGRVTARNHPLNTYFDLAYALSVRASIQWMYKFHDWMGQDCWNQVLSYSPGFFSKLGIQIKWGVSKLAGMAIGHWKSGEPKSVSGPSSNIGLDYSPSYPDADPSTLLSSPPAYTYQVQNLGATAVNSFHIEMVSEGGSLLGPITPPPGWTWQLHGDSLGFQTDVASLGPGEVATFGVSCNSCAIREAQAVLERTDGSVDAPLDIIGPGPMSDIMLEEASILSEMSVSGAVGGVVGLPAVGPDSPAVATDGSSSSAPLYAAIGGGAALLVVVLGSAGWYARRRRLR